jgi:hypothetical protein
MSLQLNDEQEQELFNYFKQEFVSCKDETSEVMLFDKIHKIGLKHFIKQILSYLDQEESFRLINMCKNRYDL